MSSQRHTRTAREEAEAIGLAVLVFLTEDGDRLGRFLADTGMAPAELSGAAGAPETLAAVLDHLLADESLLMVFAAGAGIDPAQILPARTTLGGRNEAGDGSITGAPAPVAKKKPSKRWPGP